MILGDHRQENKTKNTNSLGWIGTSTRVTTQIHSRAGRSGSSTQPNHYSQTTTGETNVDHSVHPTTTLLL
jgi:hypothetical protein